MIPVDQLATTTGSKRCWEIRVFHVSMMTSTTRDPTTQQQGWRSDLVSPWGPDHTRGSRQGHPQYTGAHHDGEAVDVPTPPLTTCDTKEHCALRTKHNMVAEPDSDVRLG